MSTASKSLKIFINSIDAAGHLNASIGLAQALAARGHRIYFLLSAALAKQYAKFGFELILLEREQEKVKEETANPFKGMVAMMKQSGLLSATSSLEKMKTMFGNNTFIEDIYQTLVQCDDQIARAIERERPHLFILDQILISPAIQRAGIPWMIISSGNPLWLYHSEELPPAGSGYPTDGDRSTWPEFFAVIEYSLERKRQYQARLNAACSFEPAAAVIARKVPHESEYLNIYGYPEELDYQDRITIPPVFARVDAFCREVPETFELPANFSIQPGDRLLYLSMGSLGGIDVPLMRRLVAILGRTPHKYIVSKGPLAAEFELAANMWGDAYLPQTKILPLVELVITHGGNNTVTEAFSFGKLMIILPLFGDQYDNAQRIQEKNFGIRLDTYSFEDDELIGAIDRLLADRPLQERAKAAAARIAKSNSKQRVCLRIEQIMEQFYEEKDSDV